MGCFMFQAVLLRCLKHTEKNKQKLLKAKSRNSSWKTAFPARPRVGPGRWHKGIADDSSLLSCLSTLLTPGKKTSFWKLHIFKFSLFFTCKPFDSALHQILSGTKVDFHFIFLDICSNAAYSWRKCIPFLCESISFKYRQHPLAISFFQRTSATSKMNT